MTDTINSNKFGSKYSIKSIFSDVQFSKSNHSSCKKILSDLFKKINIDEFLPEFITCLKICLVHEEKSANVERTLDFAADFAVSFSLDLDEDETCPLLEGVFQFIFDNHECHTPLVRLRICQLMNRLLDNMGHDATVVEETYNKIAESMLVRLQDSMSSVRTQAVYALHRLQSPNDPKCDIIQAFMYHMTHDPCHEVRRAVIQKIAVNKLTLASILTRMNDIKDSVRKEAYTIISRFLIRQFTIKQRQLILESGLGDRSEITRDFVVEVLVPNWLKYFNYNYYDFLECIHVEKIADTGIKLLKAIFAKQRDVILESRVKDMWIVNRKISFDKLNIITVVYWRALAEYVKPTDDNDKLEHIFEQVMPDLTPFCQYIREYFFPTKTDQIPPENNTENHVIEEGNESMELLDGDSTKDQLESSTSTVNQENISEPNNTTPERNIQDESKGSPHDKPEKGPHVPDEAVLVHLLEMCKVYDLADEMGRTSLKQLCVDFLQSSSVTLQSVPVLASLLDHVIPSPSTKLSTMAEIITELREPLQNNEAAVYVPDLLLLEAEEKKNELGEKITDLDAEMEIAQQLGDEGRVEEIKSAKVNLQEELKIMNTVAPHEPGRNVNNDPDTLKKCLMIVVEIMKKGKITKMDPTLYSLMHNFIMPTYKLRVWSPFIHFIREGEDALDEIDGEGTALIKNLALQALGIFCVLDAELAKEHFMMYCFNIANETLSVTALECVFDLLHVYGLAMFNIEDPDEVSIRDTPEEEGQRKPNLVVLLMSLLNSDSQEMRKTAVVGLCKLLFAGRIKSADLVSKLILLWYNPLVENDPHIRQPLGVFFRMFAINSPHGPELLLKAFIPTIKEFFKLEATDPMQEVDVENVANLMIELTRPDHNSQANKEKSIHNQIAVNICEEILSEELDSINCALLVKIMSHLELNFDLTTDISILSALVARMVKAVPKEDKVLTRLIVKFEMMLQVRQENNKTVSTVNNTLPLETSSKMRNTSQFLLSRKDDSASESEVEAEEDEELSQDVTVTKVMDCTDDIVIPGTPDSSDSELEDVFKGFDLQTDVISGSSQDSSMKSQDSDFKFPTAPAKTPFKIPTNTPRKRNSKTPAKSHISFSSDSLLDHSSKQEQVTPAKRSNLALAKTPGRTAAKTPGRTAAKTPGRTAAKTPAKTQAKTPVKTTRSATKTPAKQKVESLQTPERTSPRKTSAETSERITRSSRKRKS